MSLESAGTFAVGDQVKLKQGGGWHTYQLRVGEVVETHEGFPPKVTVKWQGQRGQYDHPPGDLANLGEAQSE